MDKNSLSHTSWNCKYHVVFAPKFRRQVIYGRLKRDIEKYKRFMWWKRNQLKEDYMADQISIKEFVDPFRGEQVNKSKNKVL